VAPFIIAIAATASWLYIMGAVFAPSTWHPSRRRRVAERQVDAMERWGYRCSDLASKAKGYLTMRDYIGVESSYLAARRIVDGEKP
jgi:hypothetical protein